LRVQLVNLANIAAYVVARIVLAQLSGQASGKFQMMAHANLNSKIFRTRPGFRFKHLQGGNMRAISRRKALHSRRFAGWSHADIHSRRSTLTIAWRALDQLYAGVIVTDNTGLIIETNRAANAIAQFGDGLLIREGRLCARRVFETTTVAKLIAGATEDKDPGAGGRMLIGRGDSLPPYVLAVMPLHAEPVDDRRFALIIVVDPARYIPSESDLADLFGLSPAEARVAAALMTGKSLANIAAAYGVQITTVRTQLRSVLRKVGVKRQFDLVRMLLSTGISSSIPLSAWWFDAALAAAQISWSFGA
jgi:DNA-binding CsgD family transcriptional regulator